VPLPIPWKAPLHDAPSKRIMINTGLVETIRYYIGPWFNGIGRTIVFNDQELPLLENKPLDLLRSGVRGGETSLLPFVTVPDDCQL